MKFAKHIITNLTFVFLFCLFFVPSCYAANIRVEPNPEIPQSQTGWVVKAIQNTLTYMSANYDKKIDHDINIKLVSKDTASEVINENDLNNNVGGNSSIGNINLVINSNSSKYYVTFLTAHELIHQYQMQEYGGTEIMNKNLWFIEGMADYIGVQVASNIDKNKYNAFITSAQTKTINANYSLSNITNRQDWSRYFNAGHSVYGKADMAILYLNENYPSQFMWTYMTYLYNEGADKALKNVYGLSIKELDNAISSGMISQNNDALDSYLDF